MSASRGVVSGVEKQKGTDYRRKGSAFTTGTGRTDLDPSLRIRRLILGPCLKRRFPNVAMAEPTLISSSKTETRRHTKHCDSIFLFPSSSH